MKKLVPENAILIPDKATLAFKGEIFDVYQWQQEMFDGSEATFEMLRRPDTVQVIGIVDGKILVLEEHQPHRGLRTSLPGGRVDKSDETLQAAAVREALEETGYEFKNWRLVGVQQPLAKMEWFIYLFVAWNVTSESTPSLDVGEKIEVQKLSFDEVKQMAVEGKGFIGESRAIFERCSSIDELAALPEFTGKEIER
jgi:ADP-ribose pyrophosphatase